MIPIPIGSDIRLRRVPLANWLLIALNLLAFAATANSAEDAWPNSLLPPLNGALPGLREYITYQFRHGDKWHLLGNMLFLWVFGNAVCDRMGGVAYTLFYLACGVVAGVVYAHFNTGALIGASGAIAGVTTAFLVLFPRNHVVLMILPFLFWQIQVPSMFLIVFKIILYDNILAPRFGGGVNSPVAYSAHLGGYGFGFFVGMILLATRALPRNQFDLLALFSRWGRRTGITTDLPIPGVAEARPIAVEELDSRPLALPRGEQLREDIIDRIAERDWPEALRLYRELDEFDRTYVLPRDQQLDIANHLDTARRFPEAVRAYETFLAAYPAALDAGEVRLFVGIICSRHLGQDERALDHLRAAISQLAREDQVRLARAEVDAIEARLAAG